MSLKNINGFTLIEILITVVILGVLTVAIISVLNPIEIINRGRDTGTLQTVTQTYSAAIRNNVVRGSFPMESDITGVSLSSEEGQTFLNKLLETDELKRSYINNTNLDNIYLTAQIEQQQIYLCFLPKSSAFNSHPLSGFDRFGQQIEHCAIGECYVCINGDNIGLVGQPIADAERLTPTPVPPPETTWYRATTGNNCNEYCQSLGMTCTEVAGSCPVFCFVTAGGNQVEARWANLYGIQDPATGYSCWGAYSCSATFRYTPLWAFNARCCCR